MRKLIAFLMVLAMMATLGGVAAAAPGNGNGATPVNIHDCTTYSDGFTECFDVHAVSNDTVTPSGNESYMSNGQGCLTVYDPSGAIYYQSCEDIHYSYHYQNGEVHEAGMSYEYTYTYPDGTTCTYEYSGHYANGQLQFERGSSSCTP